MPSDPQTILRDVFGFPEFRPPQEEVIRHFCAGGDGLLVMPTGGGKSLCYQIPALIRPGLGVVVSPLIALMHDQVTALLGKGVRATYLNSSQTPPEMREVRRQLEARELDLLYVAPERLVMDGFLKALDELEIGLFAIDEAHCVSAWGHDFRPEYLQLSLLAERYPAVPRLALTATADPDTRADIVRQLRLRDPAVFVNSFDRPNLRLSVIPKSRDHKLALLRFMRRYHPGECGIVYRLTRDSVDEMAAWLEAQGVAAVPYHAGLDDQTRKANQDRFLQEERLVVVATIAFGMGVDKPNVRFVAHLDMPKSLEDYHQQIGRGGRDGLPADAWLAFGPGDLVKLRYFINSSGADEQFKRLERRRLRDMEQYCATSRCRREILLGHFGEKHEGACGNCDNCRELQAPAEDTTSLPAPPATSPRPAPPSAAPVDVDPDQRHLLRLALACVLETGQQYSYGYLACLLTGTETPRITEAGHTELRTWGLGSAFTVADWRSLFNRAVKDGYLTVDQGEPAAVKPGARAAELLLDPPPEPAGEPAKTPAPTATPSEADEKLFQRLRATRHRLAGEAGMPAFVVLGDRTLREMASLRPRTEAEMLAVKGMGPAKWERYGELFLEEIRAFEAEEPK